MHDNNHQLTKVTGPTGIATDYTYDLLGRVTAEISPDRGTISYEYDQADNLIKRTEGRGVVTLYTYDTLERLIDVTYPASAQENITYTYDTCLNGIGRLCQIIDQSGTTDYTYDHWGNVITQTRTVASGQTFTTTYQYDAGNQLISQTLPTNRQVDLTRDTLR